MSITREDIKHIAELARLKLTPAEEEKFGSQLGSILEYINKLNKVNTKKTKATAQVSGLSDVLRSDEVKDWDREEVLAALAQGEIENNQVKVKRVL
ncbi:MAG: Asp-tRNA(Asn)/Glu-tRNA(Gln) amidotransferase subunit GatC [Patescibacteria group bacterium]|jgi:aspartyl-tRNA(Asn)/glutamyl-tRNA(Gln) amidotransferase subunit C